MPQFFTKILTLFLIIIIFYSCSHSEDNITPEIRDDLSELSLELVNTSATFTSVKIRLDEASLNEIKNISLEYSLSSDFSSVQRKEINLTDNIFDGTLRVRLKSLRPRTQYFIRAVFDTGNTVQVTDSKAFETSNFYTVLSLYDYTIEAETKRGTAGLNFTQNGNGYVFRYSFPDGDVFISRYIPKNDIWLINKIDNAEFNSFFLTSGEGIAFSVGSDIYFGLGYFPGEGGEMNRDIFKFNSHTFEISREFQYAGPFFRTFSHVMKDDKLYVFFSVDNPNMSEPDSIGTLSLEVISKDHDLKSIQADSNFTNLVLPHIYNDKVYILGSSNISETRNLLTFNEELEKLESVNDIKVNVEQNLLGFDKSFEYGDQLYAITQNRDKQLLCTYNPANNVFLKLTDLLPNDNANDIISSFMIDNVIYFETNSQNRYLIELE